MRENIELMIQPHEHNRDNNMMDARSPSGMESNTAE